MLSSKRFVALLSVVAIAAMMLVPSAAYALLENEYGLKFAGQATCVSCHGDTYADTTHGKFATPGADPSADYMWPAGRASVGEMISKDEIGITVGAGTGLREYMVFNYAYDPDNYVPGTSDPFLMVEGLEWDPAEPDLWEIASTGLEVGNYTCGNCHHLGYVTATGPAATGTHATQSATRRGMAKDPSKPETDLATWAEGMGIQCENCHGTGLELTASQGGHWNSGVGIVGFNTAATNKNAKAYSTRILDSDVCGQCHGRYKSGNNYKGYTPDLTLTDFIEDKLYGFADVPTEASFTANPSAYMFYPSGHNKGLKHSYYSEWQLSAHSWRGGVYGEAVEATSSHDGQVAILEADPRASEYMETGAGHFNAKTSGAACLACHTGEGYLKRKGADIMAGFTVTSSNSGYYGQECAVCHVAHGADTEEGEAIGMKVRDPESGNNSMCEDCHNWQKEVEANANGTDINTIVGSDGKLLAVPTPNANIDGGRPVSHPTREVYNGRGLYGVDQAGMFMPGAKCEQCHMPATRSDFPEKTAIPRYEDRSWKRYSHRMFIMEPGKAKEWGLAPWGDSCSPCHTGQTQEQLQAYIEQWQEDAATADAALKAAYASAYTRANADGTISAAEKALLGRAYFNHKAFTAEGSNGAHNPEYIVAALNMGTKWSKSVGGSFATVQAPSSVAYGSFAAIAGTIKNGDGSAAADGVVTLERLEGSSWTTVGSTKSDANGNFAFMLAPTATAQYRVVWNRCSDAKGAVEDHAADLVSSSVSIAVGAAPKTTDLVEIAGANRVETAIAMAMKAFPSGADAVVLATAYNWPDALGGSALAGAVDGPMLLVGSDPTPVLDAIDDLGATKAYILGGTGAVSGAVEDALVATLGADNVTRIAGGNRYETASLVADKVIELAGGAYDGTAFFATGANFPDALAASPLAAAKIWPVYLVAPGATTATVNDAVTSGIILGGPGVVSGDFAIDGVTMTRLAGDNRYETAAAVAAYGVDTAGLGWNKVALTLGTNYPDALAGGVLQGKDGSVLLLTPGTTLDPAAEAALSAHKDDITEVRFFGGTSVISQAVRDAVRDILN